MKNIYTTKKKKQLSLGICFSSADKILCFLVILLLFSDFNKNRMNNELSRSSHLELPKILFYQYIQRKDRALGLLFGVKTTYLIE
jgi:hypothetical protein